MRVRVAQKANRLHHAVELFRQTAKFISHHCLRPFKELKDVERCRIRCVQNRALGGRFFCLAAVFVLEEWR